MDDLELFMDVYEPMDAHIGSLELTYYNRFGHLPDDHFIIQEIQIVNDVKIVIHSGKGQLKGQK